MQINEPPKEPTKKDLLDHHLLEIRQAFNGLVGHLVACRTNPDKDYVDFRIEDIDHRITRITELVQEVCNGK